MMSEKFAMTDHPPDAKTPLTHLSKRAGFIVLLTKQGRRR